MSLQEYRRKRNFKKTAEPAPKVDRQNRRRFVIQKHDATRLHYDFRLELGGTLKSWAVPKGLPLAHGDKRLAVHVEDHPVSYIAFEGTIPKGQYGGGTVMLWDEGIFETDDPHPLKTLEKGKLHFTLKGKKLKGAWYLVRLRDSDEWLIIRGGDDHKPISKKLDDTSVRSKKSMAQLAKSDRVWESKPINDSSLKTRLQKLAAKPEARKTEPTKPKRKSGPAPKFIAPMQALLVDEPERSGEWLYEIKFDGFRALAFKHGDSVHLLSRNEKDFAEKFPEIADAMAELAIDDAILDGEIVALNKKGLSSFQLLQGLEDGERPPLYFYVFDLLQLDGQSLLNQPLTERKAALEKLLRKPPAAIRYSASLTGKLPALMKRVQHLGLEGLIGKRPGSLYEPGKRSGAWIKLKISHEQEFVIGGYTPPAGSRKHLGALIVGVYENKKLICTGKVGTGFNHALLKSLHTRFAKIARKECPFDNLPDKRERRFGQAITASVMKKCHWVKPELVAQLRFTEWTNDGRLRHPVFLGLREDKKATDVVREKPART
ncbi:ATP-dependent DNA ligase [Nibricoccus aquaticus]|uniref:DNA ligase (ATP) n=1 Tax=Nibricoccus aquaticus TaxID=2576891 RepID=A0A290Q6K7_9BACT|nr:non-homologous end-joining DNA ligase [Nibricoccus aquaticus]ATC64134.1 ATP-dependent DNA ligase [Nibricoccus aquaticus]